MNPYYDDGTVTLYHGDCMKVIPTLGAECVDLVVTDPPYFQDSTHYVPPRDGSDHPKKSIGDMSILELAFKTWSEAVMQAVKPSGTVYLFCDGQSYPLAFTALYPHAKRVRPLVWDKATSFNGYTWRHQHELIAWAELAGSLRVPTGDGDILRHRAVPLKDRVHPAQKPVSLLSALISKHEGASVLDPFAGSGGTLLAARDLGRRAIGIEIEERYCEIAADRLAERGTLLDVA